MNKPLTRLQSIAAIHASNILFAATALFISLLSGRFDGYFTSFCRFLVGLFIGFGQLSFQGTPFRIVRFKPWIGRGIFGAAGMTLYYVSIAFGTPGRASLFNNSFPVFVAIIAIFFLGERVRSTTIGGLLLAFSGIGLVLFDGVKVSLLADITGLASGILAGISYHFNKNASKTENPVVIYLGVCFVGLATNAFTVGQALSLNPISALYLVLAGICAYAAQIFITIGLRDIPTTEGSVHTFAKIPLIVIAGWVFLGNTITPRFIVGTGLLITGLFLNQLVLRPRRRAAGRSGDRPSID